MPHTPTEPDTGCGICSAPTGDDARLCRTHTDELTRNLASVPELVAELDTTRTRQARITPDSHHGRAAEQPLPWNEHAATAASVLNTTINAWALDVAHLSEDERDRLADHHYADTPAVAEWLTRNLPTLRQHPEAGQAFDELTHAIREARRAIDRPPDHEVYGQCLTQLDDGTVCHEYLYAPPGRPTITCRGCGAHHDTAKRRAWMFLHVRDMIGTIREVVTCLTLGGITTTEDKIRLMARRRRFHPVGTDASGRPLYRVSEVLTAIEDRYKHRTAAA